jgi:hypothetical protein
MLQLQHILMKISTWTQQRLTDSTPTHVLTCTPMTPWHILSRTTIFMRLPAPPLPSTIILVHRLANGNVLSPSPCRSAEYDHPSPCGWRHTRHLHPVAPPTDNRPPRGASTGRLLGASVASDLRPCSDTNCWDSPTDLSHEARWTHAETTFYCQACVSHALNFSLFIALFSSRCYKIHTEPRVYIHGQTHITDSSFPKQN